MVNSRNLPVASGHPPESFIGKAITSSQKTGTYSHFPAGRQFFWLSAFARP